MRSEFGALIEARCEKLGIKTQVELRDLLAAKLVKVSLNTLSAWHTGACPRAGRLAGLCDVLQIHGAERDRWFRVAAQGGPVEDDDRVQDAPNALPSEVA